MNSSPRLHKNLVAAVMEALETTFGKNYYADKVLERLLKSNRKWGARDRAFIAETTYEMVRWWRYLWEIYGKSPTLKRRELYRLFGIWWMDQGNELPEDWKSMEALEDFDLKRAKQQLPDEVGVWQSFPVWFDELASADLGDSWPRIAKELNRQAPLCLRTNTLKTNRQVLKDILKEEGIKARNFKGNDIGLIVDERVNTFRNPSFQGGLFEVQDCGSQLIAPLLDAKPGMRVVDACAGAGGKSLQLSAMMENKGVLIAMDVEARKLSELKKRARRNGAHNIEIRLIDSTKVVKRLYNTADRLLLDVPCSGTGVIKRNPDTKWKLQPEHLDRVRGMQREILRDYTPMVKSGGMVVYATCSILRSENEEQVQFFLEQHQEFELISEKRISPSPETDGFYMALLKRS